MESMQQTWSPVAASERYIALDLLRGFALFGVLLVNLLYFFRISLFQHILHFHSHDGRANHAIDWLAAEFLEFKAIDLFTLAFGIGLAVQAERAGLRGVRVELFLVRRLLILLAFGAAHMLLVANVDILALYAVCGLVAIPLLRLPTVVLALGGLAAIYMPSVFAGWPSDSVVVQSYAEEAARVYRSGSFSAILEFRWRETRDLIVILLACVAQKTLGLMLLGAAVWRIGVIREPRRYRSWLLAICLAAGVIGIVNTTSEVLSRTQGKPVHMTPALEALGSDVPLAFAYAAALLAWRRSERAASITAPFAAAGRMALTNYLSQSIVFTLIFYGYGFGLFGRLDPTETVAIGLAFYAAQLWFSVWWLKRYRFGPFEWVWRSLTYGRAQRLNTV